MGDDGWKWNQSRAFATAKCQCNTHNSCPAHCDAGVAKAGIGATYTLVEKVDQDGFRSTNYAGPSVGAGAYGSISKSPRDASLGVGVDASAFKAGTSQGPAFAEVNVNANTGAEVSREGARLNFLGFGAHLGTGGRYSLDTPLFSFGVKK